MSEGASLYLKNSWEWFRQKSNTKAAETWLGVYSFFESVILPFPTDFFLALMVLANRARAVRFVVVSTLASVVGAIVLYAVTVLFYAFILEPLVFTLGWSTAIAEASVAVQDYTFLATFIAAFSPIPYTPAIIAAGLLRADFVAFVAASLLGRGLRYIIVAALVYFFGEAVLPKITRHVTLFTVSVVAIVVIAVFFVANT